MPIERARLVPELAVTEIETSLRFWIEILGFAVKYARPEQGFAYMTLNGADIMLDQRNSGAIERRGIWETGAMEHPFGRGINLEIQIEDLDDLMERISNAKWPIFAGPKERWYRANDVEIGVRQVLLQDPDGYLVRLQQTLGERPAHR